MGKDRRRWLICLWCNRETHFPRQTIPRVWFGVCNSAKLYPGYGLAHEIIANPYPEYSLATIYIQDKVNIRCGLAATSNPEPVCTLPLLLVWLVLKQMVAMVHCKFFCSLADHLTKFMWRCNVQRKPPFRETQEATPHRDPCRIPLKDS